MASTSRWTCARNARVIRSTVRPGFSANTHPRSSSVDPMPTAAATSRNGICPTAALRNWVKK